MTNFEKLKSSIKELPNCDAKAVRESVSDTVNNLCFSPKPLVEDILSDSEISEKFTALSFFWIEDLVLQRRDSLFDDRNGYSVHIACIISSLFSVKKQIALLNDSQRIKDCVSELRKMHRTLQQAFSSMAFLAFDTCMKNSKFRDEFAIEAYSRGLDLDYWWETPMI